MGARRRRKADCTCAEGEVLHGPVPECWGMAGSSDSYGLFDSYLVSGKQCQCVSKDVAAGDRGTFADYSWSSRATRACAGSNAKVVYWLRHAEGQHQVPSSINCLRVRDPGLTELGKSQAKALVDSPTLVAAVDNPKEHAQLVVASPMVRTMETSILGFSDVLKDATWLLDPDIQEVPGTLLGRTLNCNHGDPAAGRDLLMKHGRVDLIPQYDNLDPEWNNREEGRFEDDNKEMRFKDFTDRLAHRDESRIVVVSHKNVLSEILGDYAPEENAGVTVYSLCGGQWIYVGREADIGV